MPNLLRTLTTLLNATFHLPRSLMILQTFDKMMDPVCIGAPIWGYQKRTTLPPVRKVSANIAHYPDAQLIFSPPFLFLMAAGNFLEKTNLKKAHISCHQEGKNMRLTTSMSCLVKPYFFPYFLINLSSILSILSLSRKKMSS